MAKGRFTSEKLEGGTNLAAYCKIKLLKLKLRVVYKVVRENGIMKIIVVFNSDYVGRLDNIRLRILAANPGWKIEVSHLLT